MASENAQQGQESKRTLKHLTRNFLCIYCPDCGDVCSIVIDRSVQDRGFDAMAKCRNVKCIYAGAVQISFGPVIEAKRPTRPKEVSNKLEPKIRNSFFRILCPYCHGVCRVRTSVQFIRAQRELYVFCQDRDHCGYRGVVFITHSYRFTHDPQGNLREIPPTPEVLQQCQQEIDLAYTKFQPKKKEPQQ